MSHLAGAGRTCCQLSATTVPAQRAALPCVTLRNRGVDERSVDLTEYVVTRWYRAPEIMLSCQVCSRWRVA